MSCHNCLQRTKATEDVGYFQLQYSWYVAKQIWYIFRASSYKNQVIEGIAIACKLICGLETAFGSRLEASTKLLY